MNRRRSAIEDELTHRERLRELAEVDLDAPVDRLRDPIDAYNAAVEDAFETFRESAPAREVFAFLEHTRWFPLVEFERPPEDVRTYVESNPAGEYAIPKLLEFAEYSPSKLAHHVDDADALKRSIATRRTYLRRIDAEPLTIGWPPAPADELRYRIRELRPLVERIADESTVTRLREIRRLTYDADYDRLQTAATATEQLSEADRKRLTDGRLDAEIEALEAERDRLTALLEESA